MSSTDEIHRFLFESTDIRGEIGSLEATLIDAIGEQDLSKLETKLLGEFLIAVALLGEVIKFDGVFTLQAQGNGAISYLMSEIDDEGHVRGIIKRNDELEFPDTENFSELMGESVLTITIDPAQGKRYQGVVPLEEESLARCLEEYFKLSEQLQTRIFLFSSDTKCGGLFIQQLPAQISISEVERENQWQTITTLAATLTPEEMFSLPPTDVLYRLFHEHECRTFTPKRIEFKCSCSRDRSANAILSLGYTEAMNLIAERDVVQIRCQFCAKNYVYSASDVNALFSEDKPLH